MEKTETPVEKVDLETLRTEREKLHIRAAELINKTEYTPDEAAEMTTLSEKLDTIDAALKEADALLDKRKSLADRLDAFKANDKKVPPGNRPESIYAVSDKRSFSFGAIGDTQARPDMSLLDASTFMSLRKDGYSDDLIHAVASPKYIRQFTDYLKTGGNIKGELVTRAMTEAGAGNVLVPMQWGQLIVNPPMNPMLRNAVNEFTVNSQVMRFPKFTTNNVNYPASPVAVNWAGETPASPTDQASNAATSSVDITVYEVYAYGAFSISLLEDNAYGLSSYIPTLFNQTLNTDLDGKMISGSGSSQPYGLDVARTSYSSTCQVTASTTGASAAIKYVDITALFYGLPQQYRANGAWLMNSDTLRQIANLTDTSGRPLYLPNYGYIGDVPGGGPQWQSGTLMGRPVVISENMSSIAQNATSIYFADFKQAYYLLNRVGSTVKVNDQTQYKNGLYEFVLRARFGGNVVQQYAIKYLRHT